MRLQAGGDHPLRQLGRVAAPEREQRLYAGALQLPLAVGPHILEEQIPKRHMPDPAGHHLGHEAAHDAGVILVAAGPGQIQGAQRQAKALGLLHQQLLAHPVDGNPFEFLVQGAEQPHHLDGRILLQLMQCPGTVFTAAPGEQYLLLCHHVSTPLAPRSCKTVLRIVRFTFRDTKAYPRW
ncbi:hypothetical protein D3C78_1266220 [compost metagenome]